MTDPRCTGPAAHHHLVIPPIMIAEDCVHPARRAETGERPRPFLERDRPSFVAVIGHVVAEQSDQIGLESIGCGNNRAHMIRGHEWVARESASTAIRSRSPFGQGSGVSRY